VETAEHRARVALVGEAALPGNRRKFELRVRDQLPRAFNARREQPMSQTDSETPAKKRPAEIAAAQGPSTLKAQMIRTVWEVPGSPSEPRKCKLECKTPASIPVTA
jgi:hypothetical protein